MRAIPDDPDGGSRKDTGHTFICGPTGSGKTVFVGFMVAMLARQGVTQVLFDKDRGLEILVRALGGEYLPLRMARRPASIRCSCPETPANVEFLKQWLRVPGARSRCHCRSREEADLDHALRGTLALESSSAPPVTTDRVHRCDPTRGHPCAALALVREHGR